MPISFACVKCQAKLKLADNLVGKSIKCPRCAVIIKVPANGAAPAAAAAAPAKAPAKTAPADPNIRDLSKASKAGAKGLAPDPNIRDLSRPKGGKPAAADDNIRDVE